jgi:hypothetical protein
VRGCAVVVMVYCKNQIPIFKGVKIHIVMFLKMFEGKN